MTSPDDAWAAPSADLVVHAARLVRAVRQTLELPAGVRVLSLLDEHGPQGITTLAELDRCSQPTMSAAVRALAEADLVVKTPDPHDARASSVRLTEGGRARLAAVRAAHGRLVAERLRAVGDWSPTDVATAVAILRAATDPDTPKENP